MRFKNTVLTGLLLWIPVIATYAVVNFILKGVDRLVNVLPSQFQPDALIGMHIPGLNLLIIIGIIYLSGVITANFFGKMLVRKGELLLSKIPLVRSIYCGVKEALQSVIKTNSTSFSQVVMVQYPREGLWSLAFVTNEKFSAPIMQNHRHDHQFDDHVLLFIPTTPNPTSGFLIVANRHDTLACDIAVDHALKMIISLGTIQPRPTSNQKIKKKKNIKSRNK